VTLSCIIPTFNRRQVLVRTIEMLLNQTLPATDIVVVDQSTEIPPDVESQLRRWHEEGRIRWVRQGEPNASRARNRGVLESTGDVVIFLDDDIVIGRDFLAHYASSFNDDSVCAVAGQILEGDGSTLSHLDPRHRDSDVGWLFYKRNYDKTLVGCFAISANMGVRREDFLAVGGMDCRYMRGAFREESDFAQRLCKSGRTIHFRPDVSLYHLGGAGIADGGARHWTRKTFWTAWHHYFGSWYFLLNHATWKSLPYLLAIDLRSAGLNKRTLRRPWMVPFHLCRWLSAFPYALWCRILGPKLINPRQDSSSTNPPSSPRS
jgi:GT2 family glycosyltransferase